MRVDGGKRKSCHATNSKPSSCSTPLAASTCSAGMHLLAAAAAAATAHDYYGAPGPHLPHLPVSLDTPSVACRRNTSHVQYNLAISQPRPVWLSLACHRALCNKSRKQQSAKRCRVLLWKPIKACANAKAKASRAGKGLRPQHRSPAVRQTYGT